MKFFETHFNRILLGILILMAMAASVHFIRAAVRAGTKRPSIMVTIPEGSTRFDIDRILDSRGVLPRGAFIGATDASLEGRLFPDTYDLYIDSNATSVIQKFLANFDLKAGPLFAAATGTAVNSQNEDRDLVIASLVQKEVSDPADMAVVAGILEKRLADGTFLNVDAALCYAKQSLHPTSTAGCTPITAADLKSDSPYNTYLHKGLPPTPISNPGVEAIEATLHPQTSTYWYYLSDPKTGATIYADTLAEQQANQRKYLR
jgi:UPF0755 protein